MTRFKKIRMHEHWNSYPVLDDQPLKNEEQIEILWPDKTKTQHVVSVKKGSRTLTDHYYVGTYQQDSAYIEVTMHGMQVPVDIVGMTARRPNNPSEKMTEAVCGMCNGHKKVLDGAGVALECPGCARARPAERSGPECRGTHEHNEEA